MSDTFFYDHVSPSIFFASLMLLISASCFVSDTDVAAAGIGAWRGAVAVDHLFCRYAFAAFDRAPRRQGGKTLEIVLRV